MESKYIQYCLIEIWSILYVNCRQKKKTHTISISFKLCVNLDVHARTNIFLRIFFFSFSPPIALFDLKKHHGNRLETRIFFVLYNFENIFKRPEYDSNSISVISSALLSEI